VNERWGDDRKLFAATRRAFSPTSADAARVRSQLDAVVRAAALVGGTIANDARDGHRTEAVASATPARQGDATPLATALRPWAGRLLALVAVGALSAGAGYRAGWHAGRTDGITSSGRAATANPAAEGTMPPTHGDAGVSARPPEATSSMPPKGLAAPSSRPTPRRRMTPEAPLATKESLIEELRVLRAVERALRDDEPAFALALLDELDRKIPAGHFVEERLATRTIARCARGDVPFGLDLGADFGERYPTSVYGLRVKEACAKTDPAAAGDESGRRLK